jgi:hypothetical protein
MHQTTLRFGPDLWSALESESKRLGVSIAQYVRDAAVSRLAIATAIDHGLEHQDLPVQDPGEPVQLVERIGVQLSSADAVRAQGRLARDRARRLRTQADVLRKQMRSWSR